jgi:hypothetical protein
MANRKENFVRDEKSNASAGNKFGGVRDQSVWELGSANRLQCIPLGRHAMMHGSFRLFEHLQEWKS